eukprot:3834664-Prymnesium_polylepis.1
MAPGAPPKPLYQRPLQPYVVPSIFAFADAEGVCLSYSLVDRAVARCASAAHDEFLAKYVRLEGVEQAVVRSCDELRALPPPLKVVLLTSEPDALAARAREALGAGAHVISAEMHIEFLPPGVHKGSALAWLCEQHGLPLSKAATFGDNHNDIEMLKVGGRVPRTPHTQPRLASPSALVQPATAHHATRPCHAVTACHRCRAGRWPRRGDGERQARGEGCGGPHARVEQCGRWCCTAVALSADRFDSDRESDRGAGATATPNTRLGSRRTSQFPRPAPRLGPALCGTCLSLIHISEPTRRS